MNQSFVLVVFLVFFVIALVFITKRNTKLQKELTAQSLADGKAFLEENSKLGFLLFNDFNQK